MTLDQALAYVHDSEYRKELARLIAAGFLSDADLATLLNGGPDAIDELVQRLFGKLDEKLLPQAISDAAAHALALGLAALAAPRVLAEARLTDVMAEAITQMDTRLEEVSRAVDRAVGAGASDEAIRAAVSTDAGREALLAPIESLLKATGAGIIGSAESAVIGGAAAFAAQEDPAMLFSWQTRQDDRVCEDVFENSCAPRDGNELTLEEWDAFGQPQGETLICTIYAKGAFSNCRCVLENAESRGAAPGPINISAAIAAGKADAEAAFEEAA
jgi:hypothetical protein